MTAGVLQDDPAQKRLAQAGELLGVTCWLIFGGIVAGSRGASGCAGRAQLGELTALYGAAMASNSRRGWQGRGS
ncbi:MAG: hypothetical protein OXF67_09775 [Cyanobacteria bacterium MAG CAR4_bin_6]|nr:hypothetical protein [Cyanobacteria bacterium MAG CAR4_bin_6]